MEEEDLEPGRGAQASKKVNPALDAGLEDHQNPLHFGRTPPKQKLEEDWGMLRHSCR